MSNARLHRAGVLLVAAACSCPRVREEPVRVPEEPPRTLELLTEGMGDEPLPPPTEPLRRDACDVPLALSPVGLMRPAGIRRMQARLVEEGFLDDGAYVEGALDAETLTAVARLQEREDIPTVGLPTYATVRALDIELDEAFRAGDEVCEDAP